MQSDYKKAKLLEKLLDAVENALLVPDSISSEPRALREVRRLALDPSDPNLNYRVFIRFVPIASLRLVSLPLLMRVGCEEGAARVLGCARVLLRVRERADAASVRLSRRAEHKAART